MNTLRKTASASFFILFGILSGTQKNNALITKEELIEQLFDIGSIQFDSFTIKVRHGYVNTPIYIDMRRIMSHPTLMKAVIKLIVNKAKNLEYDIVCGIPYAALTYAAGISLKINKPMIMPRQIAKQYGTRRAIEGVYKNGDTVLIIEDVINSGTSVLTTTELLRYEGLTVKDVIVVCDREQGAVEKMIAHGLRLHILFTMSDLLSVLEKRGKIEPETREAIQHYIQNNQCS